VGKVKREKEKKEKRRGKKTSVVVWCLTVSGRRGETEEQECGGKGDLRTAYHIFKHLRLSHLQKSKWK
jgi:hypothetical protein